MRAFKAKPFRANAATEATRSDGLTAEQHKAMLAEFDRRIASFKEKWRVCRDGNCRRRRQCLGPCNANSDKPRWSKRQYWRLRLDIIRNPPQV